MLTPCCYQQPTYGSLAGDREEEGDKSREGGESVEPFEETEEVVVDDEPFQIEEVRWESALPMQC